MRLKHKTPTNATPALVVGLVIGERASAVASMLIAFAARWRRCCRNPVISNRTWDGVTAPYCNTSGLYLRSPIRSAEAAYNARKLFLRTAGLLAGLAAIAVLILAICGPDR